MQSCLLALSTAIILSVAATETIAAPLSLQKVTVGDPSNPGALDAAINDAYKSGARNIVIRPGVYAMPNIGRTSITLSGWQNAILSAYKVTIVISDLTWMHDAIDIRNCSNVTFEGPILSQTGQTACQGKVVAVGKDAFNKAYCDWRPDTGYPMPKDGATEFPGGDANVVDARTRLLKVGCGDYYGRPMESLSNGTYRVHFDQPTLNFGVGDWLVGREGDAPFKVFLDNSRNCTLKDITMLRNGFAPLREDGGGGNRYLHCVWALGPRPQGATEDPLITNQADGMHVTGSNPGPDIENCIFQGVFLDDCIAIHGGFATVKAVSGPALTLDGTGGLAVGQPARISDQKGFFAEAVVTALKDNGDKTWTAVLDHDAQVPTPAKINNPLTDGAGYKILNCRLGNTRSRGILAKADNGLIKDNILERCGMSAISLGPEYYWGEANYVSYVTIVGNTIQGDGTAGYGGSAILVHGDGSIGNQDITILNNRFDGNYQGDIEAQWVDRLTITGNKFVGLTSSPAGTTPHSPIFLANSRSVTLSANTVKNANGYATPLVSTGANLNDVVGNNPSGIEGDHTRQATK